MIVCEFLNFTDDSVDSQLFRVNRTCLALGNRKCRIIKFLQVLMKKCANIIQNAKLLCDYTMIQVPYNRFYTSFAEKI